MKKTYSNPNMKVVKIQTVGMLANSNSPLNTSGASPVQEDFSGTTTATGNNLGRGGWFDEGEE